MFARAEAAAAAAHPNELTFELSDPGTIWVDSLAKEPGPSMKLGAASLTSRHGDSFDVATNSRPTGGGLSATATAAWEPLRAQNSFADRAHRLGGWVSGGIDNDTAKFGVESIRRS